MPHPGANRHELALLAARVEDVENALAALRAQPNALERLAGIRAGAGQTLAGRRADGNAADDSRLTARADPAVVMNAGGIGDAQGRLFALSRASGGFGASRPALMRAWCLLDIPVGGQCGNPAQREITLGKIDPFGFFDGNNVADDESHGFRNLVFVHDPLLDAGGTLVEATLIAAPPSTKNRQAGRRGPPGSATRRR